MNEKTIRRLFDVSVILKGAHAVIELAGGIAVLFVSKKFVVDMATAITADELGEDPRDKLANYIMHMAAQFSVSFKHVAAAYLISHGLVVGLLVAGLLMKKLWSYPITITVLVAFVIYQTFEFVLRRSLWVLGVTILDVVVILLTWHEYKYIKRHQTPRAGT